MEWLCIGLGERVTRGYRGGFGHRVVNLACVISHQGFFMPMKATEPSSFVVVIVIVLLLHVVVEVGHKRHNTNNHLYPKSTGMFVTDDRGYLPLQVQL